MNREENSRNFVILLDIGNVFVKFGEAELKRSILNSFENQKVNFKREYSAILNDSFLGKIGLNETWDFLTSKSPKSARKKIKENYLAETNVGLINFIKTMSKTCRIGIVSDLHQIAYSKFFRESKGFLRCCDEEFLFVSNKTEKSKHLHGAPYFKCIFE